jgi:hypothetical protein
MSKYRNKHKLTQEEKAELIKLASDMPMFPKMDANGKVITVRKTGTIADLLKMGVTNFPDGQSLLALPKTQKVWYNEDVLMNPLIMLTNAYCDKGPTEVKKVYKAYYEEHSRYIKLHKQSQIVTNKTE